MATHCICRSNSASLQLCLVTLSHIVWGGVLRIESLMGAAENYLIEHLPRKDRLRLLALCEPMQFIQADVLYKRGECTRYVYFPVNGFVSLTMQVDHNADLGLGMIGCEGVLGAHAALGVLEAPFRAQVQGSGNAWRICVVAFRKELGACAALRHSIDRYLYVQIEQLALTAACQCFHPIAKRLSRWLLMSQDRTHSSQFHITHEFLACMLGVRRVGVTIAAGELQRAGLIQYQRGEMTILNRPGLEATACSCYASACKAYRNQME